MRTFVLFIVLIRMLIYFVLKFITFIVVHVILLLLPRRVKIKAALAVWNHITRNDPAPQQADVMGPSGEVH